MAIGDSIPDSQIAGVQQYDVQDPTNGSTPGIAIPQAVLQKLMATSPAFAPKPSAPPPHPQITSLASPIPGGLQFSFVQLTSPSPYGNFIKNYRVYRNSKNNSFSGAQLIKTFPHDDSVSQKTIQVQDLVANQSAAYFVTAVDSTGLESTQPGAFQSASVNSGTFNPNVASAVGSTANPTITGGAYAVIPEMTLTITTKGGKVQLIFTASLMVSTTAAIPAKLFIALFRDGTQITTDFPFAQIPNSTTWPQQLVTIVYIDSPTAASHTFDVRWKCNTANDTGQAMGTARTWQVVELG